MYDIAIIGAGVTGCSLARELSRYKLNILLLEKDDDVSCGASKANSGIVHGGYAAQHGTLKASLCRKGNRLIPQLNRELNFGYEEMGSLVLAFSESELETLREEAANGQLNGVDDLEFWTREEVLKQEPAVSTDVLGALYCPSSGVISPYEYTIALAENAVRNGVKLKLNAKVSAISKGERSFSITTEQGEFESRLLINAAGAYADKIEQMLGLKTFDIIPRRGQYLVFQRGYGSLVNHVLFQVPTQKGKGILVTPTYWGNLMIGPDAQEVETPEDLGTDKQTLSFILDTARKTSPQIEEKKIIRSFSGIRPTANNKDFIIEESKLSGFYQAAGIDSPGLTSSAAVALYLVNIIKEKSGIDFIKKIDFDPVRPPLVNKTILKKSSEIGLSLKKPVTDSECMICRCEQVTSGVIKEAVSRGIPVTSLDAVKRRTRAGMGLCQGQFCGPRVRSLLSDLTGIEEKDIKGRGDSSGLLPERPNQAELKKMNK